MGVGRVHGGATLQQQPDHGRTGPPRRDVDREASRRLAPVAVALGKRGVHRHADIEQRPHAGRIAGPGVPGEQLAPHREHLVPERRLGFRDGARAGGVAHRAGRDETVHPRELHRDPPLPEQLEHVAPALARRAGDRGELVADDEGISAMIEQQLEHAERVVPCERVVHGIPPSASHRVRIGTVLEQVPGTLVVVPVVLPDQHHRQVVRRDPAGLHQRFHRSEVVGFRRVVDRLLVVGVGAPLEEEAGHRLVVRDAGRAIERGLALGVPARGPESRVRVGACVEERSRRPQKRRAPLRLEPQVLRQAEVVERVAAVRRDLGVDGRGIARQELADQRVVAHDGGGVDVAPRELGMLGQDGVGALEGPVPERGFDEFGPEHGLPSAHGDQAATMRTMAVAAHTTPPSCSGRSRSPSTSRARSTVLAG